MGQEPARVAAALGTDTETGLHADQAVTRLAEFGPNELLERGHKPTWRLFVEQFTNTMNVVLMIAAAVTATIGDLKDTVVIVAADPRLIESVALRINEVALTSESEPASKTVPALPDVTDALLADQRNMAFKGTAGDRGRSRPALGRRAGIAGSGRGERSGSL